MTVKSESGVQWVVLEEKQISTVRCDNF
jgi:hypothetical protein